MVTNISIGFKLKLMKTQKRKSSVKGFERSWWFLCVRNRTPTKGRFGIFAFLFVADFTLELSITNFNHLEVVLIDMCLAVHIFSSSSRIQTHYCALYTFLTGGYTHYYVLYTFPTS